MRHVVGATFCGMAAILYAANYLAAVSFMQQLTNWSTPPGRLETAYKVVGRTPEHLAYIALAIGIVYLVISELNQRKSEKTS